MKKKNIIAIVAVVLILCCAISGTFAWLQTKTATVTNTFTVGDIELELAETTGSSYKMVPGSTLTKDPTVTVKADSEACWLFVKVEESANFDTYMEYSVATGWTALAGNDGVYYREVAATSADADFEVLADNEITVKDSVTKAQLEAAATDAPTLAFTAYAIQKDNISTAAEAWTEVNA